MTGSDPLPPGLRLVRAPNPSPMTERGTNTWILGEGEVLVIDPGPAIESHLHAILAALSPGEHIARIVVTHRHADHAALAPALARASGAAVLGFHRGTAAQPASGLAGGEGIDRGFRPDLVLGDGDVIVAGGEEVTVLHTPGHLDDHVCLVWRDAAFSGDHVMGWASSIVSPPDGDMGAYMTSLDRLAAAAARRLFPGHGDPIADGPARIAELRRHRLAREAAILQALAGGPCGVDDIARGVYAGTPAELLPAARRNIIAHLLDLERKGRVVAADDGAGEPRYALA